MAISVLGLEADIEWPLLLRCTNVICYAPRGPGFGIITMRRRNFTTLLGGAAMRSKTEARPTIGGRTSWQHGKNGFG
jgi:hypothetical protein